VSGEYVPPEESYEDSYEYEEPAMPEPPPPPPVEEPPPPPPPVEQAPPPPPPPVDAPPPPPPPVEQAPPPPPVEEPPPPVEEPPPVEQSEPAAPPPAPASGPEGLPPEVPTDSETLAQGEVAVAVESDASDVMRPGQPGADELPEDVVSDTAPVEPGWVSEGEPPFSVSEREVPLDSVVGPGEPFELRWDDQADTGYCATCAAATVISEVSGRPVGRDEIVAHAADAGLLSFGDSGAVRGTSPGAVGELLAAYGIESSLTTGEHDAWQRLDEALATDRRVVLPLDQPGYGQLGDEVSVAVTTVDRERGVILATDSASGPPLEVPLGSFEEAWRQSDFAMTSVRDAPYDVLGTTMHVDVGLSTTAAPLADLPAGGDAALGDWWATAGEPVGCCVAPAEPAATPLEFTDQSGSVHQLPGVDTTGTGQADVATLDANGDGVPDTCMFDTTGTGEADLVYYDSTGTGELDSVSYSADDGQWAEPMPLTTALNSALPDAQPGTPVAMPPAQAPVELIDAISNFTVSADQLASTGTNLVITYDQPQGANLVITDPQPQGGEVVVVPSPYAPAPGQLDAVSGQWTPHLIDTTRPAPQLDPNLIDVYSLRRSLQRMYASQSIINNALLLPDGIERRYNPLTGSTNDVPRGSLYP
jgi:hypothetical protein